MSEDLPSWILESMSSPLMSSSSWGDDTLLLWGDRGGDRTALLLLRYSVDSNTERGGSQSGSSCDMLAKYLRTGALFVSYLEQELFWTVYLSPQELAHNAWLSLMSVVECEYIPGVWERRRIGLRTSCELSAVAMSVKKYDLEFLKICMVF